MLKRGPMKLALRSPCASLLSLLSILSLLSLLSLAACSTGPATEDVADTEDPLRTTYGDLLETLAPGDLERWLAVRASLEEGLVRLVPGVTPVRLACSSTRAARKMKDCLWVLAASDDRVDGASGGITGEIRVWSCRVPVAGSARTMLEALASAGADALTTTVPGTGRSFYDALVDCVAQGGPRVPPSSPATDGPWVDLGGAQWDAGDGPGATWLDVTRRLRARFDDVCGDTFCEGDYPDIAALGFACAVDATSSRVASCSWSFAAADTAVDARGHVTAGTKTTRCPIAIDAQSVALTTTLDVADPLHTPLPDREGSLYDALGACL